MEDENVINIDCKGYQEADLSNQQKYIVAQLKDLSMKAKDDWKGNEDWTDIDKAITDGKAYVG